MTYSLDFRKQVLKSLDEGMTFAGAAEFYNLNPTTIQNWKRRVHSKTTRQTKPYKIPDDVLLNDVEQYLDDYQYERARRLNCSKTGIYHALKRLGISQKKDLRASKSLSDKKSSISEKA
jgi:transposase